jgi:hypothetical protein
MSLPPLERYPLPKLSPERKKERTLEALLRQLEGLARQQPVVMVFEDAHWIEGRPPSRRHSLRSRSTVRASFALLTIEKTAAVGSIGLGGANWRHTQKS